MKIDSSTIDVPSCELYYLSCYVDRHATDLSVREQLGNISAPKIIVLYEDTYILVSRTYNIEALHEETYWLTSDSE